MGQELAKEDAVAVSGLLGEKRQLSQRQEEGK